jgi:uncharacterized membrane protein
MELTQNLEHIFMKTKKFIQTLKNIVFTILTILFVLSGILVLPKVFQESFNSAAGAGSVIGSLLVVAIFFGIAWLFWKNRK